MAPHQVLALYTKSGGVVIEGRTEGSRLSSWPGRGVPSKA